MGDVFGSRAVAQGMHSLQLKAKEDEVIGLTGVHTATKAQYDRRVAELEDKVGGL